MYEYKPQRQNSIAYLLIAALFLLALVSFVISAFVKIAWIPQTVGLLLMVPMIQLVTRYVAGRYLYRICPYEDGNVDLDIYVYRGGANMQLVCRLGLEEITAAASLTDANRKPPKGMKRYNYCPEMFPAKAMVLSITNGDGDCEIVFCPDEKMADIVTPKNGVTWTYTPPAESAETVPEDSAENSEN
ncbi:MAG: hypothetical protein IJY22_02560 [Clostridia bacterium]|nr:hypothetical protein [Clostridia bacterium]